MAHDAGDLVGRGDVDGGCLPGGFGDGCDGGAGGRGEPAAGGAAGDWNPSSGVLAPITTAEAREFLSSAARSFRFNLSKARERSDRHAIRLGERGDSLDATCAWLEIQVLMVERIERQLQVGFAEVLP